MPIEIGTENSLLRELGLPFDAYKDSISAMHPYQIENTVNLRSALSKALDGPWMWYRGGMVTPGCPDWGVRWLMLQTPLQASFLQLNFLDMKVSGMDSTRVFPVEMDDATYKATVFKQSLPMMAVDKHSTCDEHEEWNYDNPSCWAQKHPICAQGALQSPIHIERSTVTTQGKDNFLNKCSWRPVTGLHVVNFGKGLAIPTNQIGYITLTGEDGFPDFFEVVQLQLHMPSEHMIDGKSFAAELQVVHRHQASVTQGVNSADSFPFVTASFMFQMGDKDSALLKQFFLPGVLEPNTFRENEIAVDLMRSLGPALDGDFYSYMGSSTTPDCFQQNKWFVFDHVFNMSMEQWATFKAMFPSPGNNRPVQPIRSHNIAKNSFQDGGEPKQFDFFLGRHEARDRFFPGEFFILVPIVATLLLMTVIMLSIFKRDVIGGKSNMSTLAETIGNSMGYSQV